MIPCEQVPTCSTEVHEEEERIERIEADCPREAFYGELRFTAKHVHPAPELPRNRKVWVQGNGSVEQSRSLVDLASNVSKALPGPTKNGRIIWFKHSSTSRDAKNLSNDGSAIITHRYVLAFEQPALAYKGVGYGKFRINIGCLLQNIASGTNCGQDEGRVISCG